jgi:choline dehydrogenase-like flavoprotein
MTGISFEVNEGIETLDDLRRGSPDAIAAAMAAWKANRTGPFTTGGIGSFAIMPVLQFQSEEGKEELEELLASYPVHRNDEQPVESEYHNFVASTLSSKDDGSGAFWLAPALATFGEFSSDLGQTNHSNSERYLTIGFTNPHPFSRGSSHITSSNPDDKPEIDTCYLKHPLDVEVIARHLTLIETLARTQPMRNLIKDPENGLRNNPLAKAKTIDEARTWAKVGSISNWHPVGTCTMLPKEKGGVVGHDLLVHGVKGLRIVDSSIMPVITRGNPQTTVYAVAERAADLILGEQ